MPRRDPQPARLNAIEAPPGPGAHAPEGTATHRREARRRAGGGGAVAIRKHQSVLRQLINVGGRDHFGAIHAHIAIADIVEKDNDEVGFAD